MGDVTGIVLAGGRSTRFGRDKLTEPYRGAPLLHHAIVRLAEVCREVVVVLAPDVPEPELPAGAAVRVAHDPVEGRGPLAGLSAGLAEVRTDLAVVAAGDMPEVSTAVLIEMLEAATRTPVEVVALQDGGSIRPLPMVVRTEAARQAAHALLRREERSLTALLRALRASAVDQRTWQALDPRRTTLRDVDSPEDLDA